MSSSQRADRQDDAVELHQLDGLGQLSAAVLTCLISVSVRAWIRPKTAGIALRAKRAAGDQALGTAHQCEVARLSGLKQGLGAEAPKLAAAVSPLTESPVTVDRFAANETRMREAPGSRGKLGSRTDDLG